MEPLEIRDDIATYLEAQWTTTPIDWPNITFDPKKDAPLGSWIRPTIRYASSVVGELGYDGVGHRYGILIIDIFVPKDKGVRRALGYADTIEGLFRRTANLTGIEFDEPTTEEKGVDVPYGKYHVSVSISFNTFIGE